MCLMEVLVTTDMLGGRGCGIDVFVQIWLKHLHRLDSDLLYFQHAYIPHNGIVFLEAKTSAWQHTAIVYLLTPVPLWF